MCVCEELMSWYPLRADEDGSAGREVTKVNGLEKEGGREEVKSFY